MTKLRNLVLAMALAAVAAGPAAAQQKQTDEKKVSITALLKAGFDIADMQYLANSIVFVLQRHDIAYICDANLNGETKICVRLK